MLRCKATKKLKSTKIKLSYLKMSGFSLKIIKINHLVFIQCQLMLVLNNSNNWSINLLIKILKLEKDNNSISFIKPKRSKINSKLSFNKFNIKIFKQTFKSFIIQYRILKLSQSPELLQVCMGILKQSYH